MNAKSKPVQPPKTKSNAIALCCTAGWIPLAAITLLSCTQQGAAAIADFYVLVTDANVEQKAQFASFCRQHGFSAKLIDATLPPSLAKLPTQRFSPAALLRLTLDRFLPQHYERVLYLDCDILAMSPVQEIFAAPLVGKSLGAVEDYESLPGPLRLISDHPRQIGLAPGERYFNSGVLLFDWPRTLRLNLLPACVAQMSATQEKGTAQRLPDQDVLNLAFRGEWQNLPVRFNLMAFFVDYFPQHPVFRHFTTRYKPWLKIWLPGLTPYHAYYRDAFAQSPWPGFAAPRFQRAAVMESLGSSLRKVDFISRRRYARHLASL
jgi:lipopolysaccharide biosynthesis glycosyltransferase